MPSNNTPDEDGFPAIDLQLRYQQKTVDCVAQLLHRFGAFRVRNHGLPSEIIPELFNTARAFFGQPLSIKNMEPFYLPFGAEKVRNEVILKETIKFGHSQDNPTPVNAFTTAIHPLVKELFELLSTALGLNKPLGTHHTSEDANLTMHYYPPGPSKGRNPAHQDFDTLTLLFQEQYSTSSGLQVADLASTTAVNSAKVNETARFIDINLQDDEFLLIIGHSLSKWIRANSSLGRKYLTPCVHKVSSPTGRDQEDSDAPARYSLAYFVDLAQDMSLGNETVGEYLNRLKSASRAVTTA